MATVFFFSSTGNSLYLAKRISTALDAHSVFMKKEITVCDDDCIGFVFPAFFYGLPKTVTEFLTSLTITAKDPYLFSIVTYGSEIVGVNGKVEKLLKEKGHHLSYSGTIKCVENYLPMYTINNTPEVQKSTEEQLSVVLEDLTNKLRIPAEKTTFWNRLIYSAYPGKKAGCDRYFTINGCNGCGICTQICSRKNIKLAEGTPVFGSDCELCLACLHACPKNAISWKKTKGKGQYRNPHVNLNDLISSRSKSTD